MKCIIKDNSTKSSGNYLSINISNLIQPWLNFFFQKEEVESVKHRLGGKGSSKCVINWKDSLQCLCTGLSYAHVIMHTRYHPLPSWLCFNSNILSRGDLKDVNSDFKCHMAFPLALQAGLAVARHLASPLCPLKLKSSGYLNPSLTHQSPSGTGMMM